MMSLFVDHGLKQTIYISFVSWVL